MIPKVVRAAVIARDGLTCRLCGEPVAPDVLEIDHIYPCGQGGPTHPDNLQVTHARCNLLKGKEPMPGAVRPTLPCLDPSKRKRAVYVRLSPEEKANLDTASRGAGTFTATWVRQAALRASRPEAAR